MNNSQGCRATITFHPGHKDSLIQWDDYYGLNDGQMNLVESLFERKIIKGETETRLNAEEIRNLYGEIEECEESLRELNILL